MASPGFSQHQGDGSSLTSSPYSQRFRSPMQTPNDFSSPGPQSAASVRHTYSPISSLPPVLPPIPRVASRYESTEARPQTLRTQSEAVTTSAKRRVNQGNVSSSDSSPSQSFSPGSTLNNSSDGWASNTTPVPLLSKQERSVSYSAPLTHVAPEHTESSKGARTVSLAVPYATTPAASQPKVGIRPLQATSTVKGVPQHGRTSSPVVEASQPKGGKRGLNLLNPVHLLMRRRSSQPPSALAGEANASKVLTVPPMDLPDDYDPRIRGNTVHDFSAPRTRKSVSHATTVNETQSSELATPVSSMNQGLMTFEFEESQRPRTASNVSQNRTSEFREHLDDNLDGEQRKSAVHAETLANQDFLSRVSWQSQQSEESAVLPPFARKSQHFDPQHSSFSSEDWKTRLSGPSSISSRSEPSEVNYLQPNDGSSLQSPASSNIAPQNHSLGPDPDDQLTRFSLASTMSDTGDQSRTPVPVSEASPGQSPNTELPRHLKSNASRFSFQMAGQDAIAEEKLLEEKAKLKGASGPEPDETPVEDDDEDFFDEDAMYDHDELEGINDPEGADLDTQATASSQAVGLGIITNLNPPSVLVGSSPERPSFEYADDRTLSTQRPSEYCDQPSIDPDSLYAPRRASSDYGDSDGRSDSHQEFSTLSLAPIGTNTDVSRRSRQSHEFDDDLYFHDGAIELYPNEEPSRLNEDDFDDPNFLKKNKGAQEDLPSSSYGDTGKSPNDYFPDDAMSREQVSLPFHTETRPQETLEMQSEDLERPGDKSPLPSRQDSQCNTTGLAAYHSALADSVTKAAASGRFSRQTSSGTTSSTYSAQPAQRTYSNMPVQTTDFPVPRTKSPPVHQSRDSYSGFDFDFNGSAIHSTNAATPVSASFPVNAFSTEDNAYYEDDGFDADDSIDAIISEANADALASDDAGFYGQEFGFYANANPGATNAESFNGGYFGEPGFQMVQRSWSTKEPNLTPITERSEFSTRNSYIGGPFSPSGLPYNNPAFAAQLSRMSPMALAHLHEEDRSLDQVLRAHNQAIHSSDGLPHSESMSSMSSGVGHAPGYASSRRGSWQMSGVGSQFMPKGGVPMSFQYSTDSSHSSTRMSRSQSENMQDTSPLPTAPYTPGDHLAYLSSPIAGSPASSARSQGLGLHTPDPDATPRKGYVDSSSPQAASPAQKPPSRPMKTHSRNGSGADSVTYKREQDADGNERWVLERRRTAETGLMELIGREIVEGGRI